MNTIHNTQKTIVAQLYLDRDVQCSATQCNESTSAEIKSTSTEMSLFHNFKNCWNLEVTGQLSLYSLYIKTIILIHF